MTTDSEKSDGFFMAGVGLPWPAVFVPEALLISHADDNRILHISHTSSMTLKIVAEKIENGTIQSRMECTSCRLVVPEPAMMMLGVMWKFPNFIKITINQAVVGTTASGAIIPETFVVERGPGKDIPPASDFSSDNLLAIKKRYQRLVGYQEIPGHARVGTEYMIEAFAAEAAQLRDLLALVSEGKSHHIIGLASLLRRLVAEGRPLPLLQHCAAAFKQPIIIYSDRMPEKELIIPEQVHFINNFRANPDHVCSNPVDIDVWLGFRAAHLGSRSFTHKALIKAIGNKVGAHIAFDLPDEIIAMRRLSIGLGLDSGGMNFLVTYVLSLADCMLSVSEDLLWRIRPKPT
jgi:hypothetical protein